uniref:Secreted protein n=1 Tax=Thraustotheca clavata TaxID=74557 RepID=A0A0A7CLH5_9STRA|nr:secreted protein [Thraustotheca clavata]
MWSAVSVASAIAQLLVAYFQFLPAGIPDWPLIALQQHAYIRSSAVNQKEQGVNTNNGPFNWQPCPNHLNDLRFQCGNLIVPLDHLDKNNNATISIAVQKYTTNATKSLGTILLNPGGPGGAGTSFAVPELNLITGGQYDVLGFDPRGIGKSRLLQCSKNEFTAAQESAIAEQLEVPFTLTGVTDDTVEMFASNFELYVKRCELYDKDYLKYLSTAYVARDMDLIREALGEELTHYYGISYGTFLGATYANMFPNRVGRFVIDSVLDPEVYTGPTPELFLRSVSDVDAVFTAFADQCEAAGPGSCPLADASAKRPYLMDRLQSFLTKVAKDPLIVPGGDDITQVTETNIRQKILQYMYSLEVGWPKLAATFHAMMTNNYSLPLTNDSCAAFVVPNDVGMASTAYISNDGLPAAQLNWTSAIQKGTTLIPLAGVAGWTSLISSKSWSVRPVERYSGPWGKNYTNKVLILNNQYDPATPWSSAANLHKLMGTNNSVFVTREGYGHGSAFSQPSSCIHNLLTSFYTNGSYPTARNCSIDKTPFEVAPALSEAAKAMQMLAAVRHPKQLF